MSQRVRAESVAMSGGNGGASFSGFADFDADVASGATSPKGADLSSSNGANNGSPRALRMAKRTSILEGFSQQELISQHRRSLAGLQPAPESAATALPSEEDLAGVTLSKRHTFTKKEYEAGQHEELFHQLEGFKAGFDDDDDTEERRRDDDDVPSPKAGSGSPKNGKA
eukprot:CAMPEP_0174829522 /NCGR_PEP_ID=MMETSP1114-20130205/1974_1 /TAXON_ID=312471 /ORGANISM="Neobodo designis, Strain CCAP 1951/1" /LENGTH=168 /DNA_ID=CAMNT_0016063273 /DNA_START=171 /DNA_END=677 /DNA_ORIENTATION=-